MASTLQNLLKSKAEKDKAKESEKPKLEIVENNSNVQPTTPKQSLLVPTTTNYPQVLPTPTNQNNKTSTSPTKNFTKVPNSITTEAIPQGMFKGLSKHTYDVLYKLTRGAINPVREIQLTRLELMKLTGLSENTQRAHIKYLSMTGLIKVAYQTGKHEGATYEVFIPEELPGLTPPNSSQVVPSTTNQYQPQVSSSNEYQNLVPDTSQKLAGVSTTNLTENKDTYGFPKTSFKTLKYIDDEAPVIDVLDKLNEMARKLTGKDLTKKDLEKFPALIEILISETVIAAARTGSVSATMAFMTENLRRRLYSKPRPAGKKEARPKHLDVGKGSEEEISSALQPQTPLSEEQRENTLTALREAKEANSIFFKEFKTYGEIEYTPEDFKWLMENLEKGSE